MNGPETWVMRQMGAAFDPETTCQYSGRKLWRFPILAGDAWLMGYFREPDAYLFRVRPMMPEDWSPWASREAFEADKLRFEAWRDRCRGV